jgi:hypothetical protein
MQPVTASEQWQSLTLKASQLKKKGMDLALRDWSEATSIRIRPKPGMDITKVVFANFKWVAGGAQ